MAKSGRDVDGDGDGDGDEPTNRPSPKRCRLSAATNSRDRPTTSSATNSRDRPTTSAAAASENDYLEGEYSERQSSYESMASCSRTDIEYLEEEYSERQSSYESMASCSRTDIEVHEEDTQQQQSGFEVFESRADRIASESDEETSGSVSFTLSDPDVLNCPICFEPLCSPVYQCENGHTACASCCTTMENRCSNCRLPIGYIRCRAIEKVLESVKVTCRNKQRGCKVIVSYSNKLAHENACAYTRCSCPHLGCHYVGISKCVNEHFALEHSQSSVQFYLFEAISITLDRNQEVVFLQEKYLKTLFILNHSVESAGSFVNVVCVAPTSEKGEFLYSLTASVEESKVTLESSVDAMPKWVAQAQPPSEIYLMVPSRFTSSSGQLKLELTIRRSPLSHFIFNEYVSLL